MQYDGDISLNYITTTDAYVLLAPTEEWRGHVTYQPLRHFCTTIKE